MKLRKRHARNKHELVSENPVLEDELPEPLLDFDLEDPCETEASRKLSFEPSSATRTSNCHSPDIKDEDPSKWQRGYKNPNIKGLLKLTFVLALIQFCTLN